MISILIFLFVIGPLLLFLFGGLEPISSDIRIKNKILEYVLFMIDTFTTNNYSLLQPSNLLVRIISSLINMICIFLIGLLGYVVGNRIRKN